MSVEVIFRLDTRTEQKTVSIATPFDDRAKAADKVASLLQDTAKSSSAMMKMRDHGSGDYVFINTMKIQSVDVVKVEP